MHKTTQEDGEHQAGGHKWKGMRDGMHRAKYAKGGGGGGSGAADLLAGIPAQKQRQRRRNQQRVTAYQ